jgi:hypothetical protein
MCHMFCAGKDADRLLRIGDITGGEASSIFWTPKPVMWLHMADIMRGEM